LLAQVQHTFCNVNYAVATEQFKCYGIYTNKGDVMNLAQEFDYGFWYTWKDSKDSQTENEEINS
jgi:hypothetical protein